mmetsp:Transcript_24064/g.71315  ORF Transcript_24064/g.71315 Transcript_24064/m.71315 type:complete len:262 (-) Transcript_24064:286-1071(-)
MLVVRHHVLVRVRDGEVGEDVGAADGDVEGVEPERAAESEVAKGGVPERVPQRHVAELELVAHAEGVLRVLHELPAEGDEGGDHAAEEERRLPREPRLARAARLCTDEAVEGDERHRLQVRVGAELLGRGVVLVVLVAPVAAGHAAAKAVDDHLHVPVQLDVARERVVTSLVLQPAAPALRDAGDNRAEEPVAGPDEADARPVHGDHLSHAVRHVPQVGLKVPLRLQLRPQGLKVGRERVAREAVRDGARWEGAEHLVRLL